MMGKIFITRSGYDPQLGKHVKDPYLGDLPTLGACRPDIREQLKEGDHLFAISGKVRGVDQYVMGGFEIESKVDAMEAYKRFPNLRLHKRPDGQLDGNIIVSADGAQHSLDDHEPKSFNRRIKNYVIGRNPILLLTEVQIAEGRRQTLEMLSDILQKKGKSPWEVVGRYGSRLSEKQVVQLREWLIAITNPTERWLYDHQTQTLVQ